MFDQIKKMFQPGGKSSSATRAYRILTVEDTEIDRKIIIKSLSSKGYDILIARNGQEGVDMAVAQKPDFVDARKYRGRKDSRCLKGYKKPVLQVERCIAFLGGAGYGNAPRRPKRQHRSPQC